MNLNEHIENRNRFPREELERYENQHVAWSLDGKRIVASDEDPVTLIAKLEAAGHKSDDYVLSFVDFETHMGGDFLSEDWEKTE